MDFLSEITRTRRARLATAKESRPASDLYAAARRVRSGMAPHRLRAALERSSRINVIAEIKRASPSRGVIRPVVDVGRLAGLYQEAGAAAVSVLTEEDRFQGSLSDLREARAAIRIPVLRKDFILDEYMVFESAEAGADAVLLIAALLDDRMLRELRLLVEDELQMDALVEVHTREETERALSCGAGIIGVNNRNLRSFSVSLDVSRSLATLASPQTVLVTESGLSTAADLKELRALGYRGFLIGETLMRAAEPDIALRRLLDESAKI